MTGATLSRDASSQDVPGGAPAIRSSYAWTVVCALSVGYLFATVVRFLLGVALPAIKADLALSDTQLGLLTGPAFALSFCLFSLPMGRLADVFHRCRLIAIGILLWSLATAALAFTNSFAAMFLAIVFVGIGEAAFMPAASSLTAAYFAPDRVGRAMSVVMAGGSLGKVTAFVVGGAILALLAGSSASFMGFDLAPWRQLFLIAAAPGLLLTAIFLVLRDPRDAHAPRPPFRDALRHLNSRKTVYALHIGYSSCAVLVITVLAVWSSSLYVRNFNLDLPTAAVVSGIATAIGGPVGFFIGGTALDWWRSRGSKSAPPIIMAIALTASIPCGIAFSLSDNLIYSLVGYGLAQTAVQVGGAAAIVGMLMLTPPQHRGIVMSLYAVVVALTSAGIGPALIGIINDGVYDGQNLAAALLTVLLGTAGLGVVLTMLALRIFAPAVVE